MLLLMIVVLLTTSGEGLYLVYHEELKTYHDARSACQSSGLDLLVLKSAAEIDLLNEFLSNLTSIPQHIWIGLDKYNGKNNFTWLDYRGISYNFWESGEPDGWSYQHCVCIQKSNLRWNSRRCGIEMYFICGRLTVDYRVDHGLFYLLSRNASIISNSTLTFETNRNIRCAKYCVGHNHCDFFTLSENVCIIHMQALVNSVYTSEGVDLWTRR